MKQILCADCGNPIKSVDNLATEAKLFFLGVKPYHFGCFKHFIEKPMLFPLSLVFFPFVRETLLIIGQTNGIFLPCLALLDCCQ